MESLGLAGTLGPGDAWVYVLDYLYYAYILIYVLVAVLTQVELALVYWLNCLTLWNDWLQCLEWYVLTCCAFVNIFNSVFGSRKLFAPDIVTCAFIIGSKDSAIRQRLINSKTQQRFVKDKAKTSGPRMKTNGCSYPKKKLKISQKRLEASVELRAGIARNGWIDWIISAKPEEL